ncbi:hypothetical protein WJX79_003476 [Trebouxia sp. C0005]|nr:MAG: hypothetical protein FRX49_02939 [Trebouxia sp. A1-2]
MVKVFVTGGTGFVGSRVIRLLVAHGHQISALARRTGTELDKLNVKIIQGSVTDLDIIASAVAGSEAVMHLAFGHDFTKYQEAIEQDIAVIRTINKALQGSGKLFVSTCTTSVMGDTKQDIVSETTPVSQSRGVAEIAALAGNDTGVRAVVMRLPPFVYARGFSFFYNVMYKAAEKNGSASYIGAGDNKMCAVHADDAARAYVALLTRSRLLSARGIYNVVGENGVTSKDVAEIIASKLHCGTGSVTREEAEKLFGFVVAMRTGINNQADDSKTQYELDWKPQYTSIKAVM